MKIVREVVSTDDKHKTEFFTLSRGTWEIWVHKTCRLTVKIVNSRTNMTLHYTMMNFLMTPGDSVEGLDTVKTKIIYRCGQRPEDLSLIVEAEAA